MRAASGFVWWESPLATIRVQKGELLPYMVGNSPALPFMVMGNPTGYGIQFNYTGQRSELD